MSNRDRSPVAIGRRVQRARDLAGISQEALAQMCPSVGLSALQKIERGTSKGGPNSGSIIDIAEALDLRTDWLLLGVGPMSATSDDDSEIDDDRPVVDKILAASIADAAKRAWIRERMPDFAFSSGATKSAIMVSIEALENAYDEDVKGKLPLPQRERVKEASRLPEGVKKRGR